MSVAVPEIQAIPAERVDDVVDVFADAFGDYPVMRYTVGPDGDVAARVRRLVRLFVTRRVARTGPMWGMFNREKSTGKNLSGAILLTLPDEPAAAEDVARISADAWRELGEDARLRYDEYAKASNFFGTFPPHVHLNMIGVRRVYKGTGLGRRLLEKTRELAAQDRRYSGVSLTTENPRNVDLYQHFGYEVVGHATFGSGLETWGMFLPLR